MDRTHHLKPPTVKNNSPIYQLKVVLLGSEPPVWRRLQVPAEARLDWLHAVLQVAIGWTNSHLHQFIVGEQCYSDTRHSFAEFEGDPETQEERKSTLQQIAPHAQDAFGYEYDFGDSWEHEIVVEKILPPDSSLATTARCLDGARACPPEDCGGVWGYEDLLKILKNRKHSEHKSMKEWLGRPFDAEGFDLEKVNVWLRKLKWPRVTEAQLRKVLMGRDNYHQ
ncbi:MAG: plasmid pRiA4b ORF-3 family protein [Verrucomicrobia bacterium]|nr:plasmid pRiA4b ORF-3 family protein [Verrucomicrobiota bacterium]